jgi:hypothetical protein
MALTDELKAYITKNAKANPAISEKHNVAIIGETHAFLKSDEANIRTTAAVRVLLELLKDSRYRYFANESYLNAGPVRVALRNYLRDQSLPPAFDPKQTLDTTEVARRVLPRRYQAVLDFLRANPRYVLPIGSSQGFGAARDARLAQHLFEEVADRKLTSVTPGIVLLGALHAAAVADESWPTTRMLIEKRGYSCVSVRVLTDFQRKGEDPDDRVVPLGANLSHITPGDIIRLTSLVSKSPVTIPTRANGQASPFSKVTFGESNNAVADQFEYVVLHKA